MLSVIPPADVAQARTSAMEDGNIKILTLYPSSEETALIKCSVVPHSLSQSSSYEALSYTWGDPADICSVPIEINGCAKQISTNLEAALRVLRHGDSPRVLWIDALCINQEDKSEKSRQIAKMGSIYASAVHVLIWLGPGDEESDFAMSIIGRLNSAADFDNITEIGWNAMENLFSRAWFKRIWVVQEFKRGRSPVFQCGQKTFSWDTACDILQKLWTSEDSVCKKHVKLLGEVGKIVSMVATRADLPPITLIDISHAACSFVQMLRVYGGCQATEPRDKIYGLLGLSDAFSFSGGNAPAIDYTKPVNDVYTDWARFLIKTQRALDILYMSPRMQRHFDLPSWVPDWRNAPNDLWLTLDVFKDSFKYDRPSEIVLDPVPYFNNYGQYLSIHGFVVITIKRDFTFSDPDIKFIASKLDSRPRVELVNSFLTMGCKLKNAPVEDFAAHGLAECRKEFRYQGFHCIIPKATTDGDIVCVLGNSEIPFVLRPVGDKYELVGDAYVEHRSTDFLPKVITFTIQ